MIKFEDIQNANSTIKTTPIKGKNYAEVNQRIKAFRMCYPNGSITTEIISLENGVVTMKSTVQDEEGKILGTGLAFEKESSSFINKTSFIENCETSAVGRALGMCGFGIDASIASYEEVVNAIENQNKADGETNTNKQANTQPTKKEAPTQTEQSNRKASTTNCTTNYREKLIEYCVEKGINMSEIAKNYGVNGKTTQERFREVLEELKKEASK